MKNTGKKHAKRLTLAPLTFEDAVKKILAASTAKYKRAWGIQELLGKRKQRWRRKSSRFDGIVAEI